MSAYENDIENAARGEITERKDEVKEAIIAGDEFDRVDSLTDACNEHEFYYTAEDALVVIGESNNTEDVGKEFDGEPEDGIVYKARRASESDLREKMKEIYDELDSNYQSAMMDHDKSDGETDEMHEMSFNKIWQEFLDEEKVEPLKKNSEYERTQITQWLRLNSTVGMRGGYPLGQSYIDARCGAGYDDDGEQANYVTFDRKTAKYLPHLRGKYRPDVIKYYKKTYGKLPKEIRE